MERPPPNYSMWVVAGLTVLALAVLPLIPAPGERHAAIKGSEGLTAPRMVVWLDDKPLAPHDVVRADARLMIRYTLAEPAVVGLIVEEGKGGSLAWQSDAVLSKGDHEIQLGKDDKPLMAEGSLTVGLLVSTQPFQPVLYDLDLLCIPGDPCARLDLKVR